ncbi:MAG: hypothetical protein V8R08_03395 [Coriobacteriales bacterium]
MKMRKLLTVAISAVMAFSLFALIGCGSSNPEQVIRQGLSEEFDSVKNLNEDTLEELVGNSLNQFQQYGIDMKEFLRSYFEGFDYNIGDITVDGDTAEAEVTMKIKSYSQFMEDYEADVNQYVLDLQSNPSALSSMTQEDLLAQLGPIMMETLKDVPVVETAPVIIECTKKGNTWEVADSAEQAIQSAMLES